jgi:hypothetical protein
MWIYFLERENEKVVILSDQALLDATRETKEELEKFNIRYTFAYTHMEDPEYDKQAWKRSGYEVASIEWLAEAVVGWHCTLKDKPITQPLMKYEDIFKDRHKKKKIRKRRKQMERQAFTKPLPHQRWVWNKNHIIEGTIETIVEEAIRRGLIFELIFSEIGREFAYYYGEAFKDLVRKKIRGLF